MYRFQLMVITFLLSILNGLSYSKGLYQDQIGSQQQQQQQQLLQSNNIDQIKFPYLAFIRAFREDYRINETIYLKKFQFSGAIIKPNVVLTAAHCLYFVEPQNTTVYAGVLNNEIGLQQSVAKRIVYYENFTYVAVNDDIALIFLETAFNLTQHVKLINLPLPTDYNYGVPAVTIAWGGKTPKENGLNPSASDWLKPVNLIQFPRTLCQRHTNLTLTDNMICVIDPDYKQTVCKGDSGGPLVFRNRIIGITSWGANPIISPNSRIVRCSPTEPTVFTKVLSYVEWINMKILEN